MTEPPRVPTATEFRRGFIDHQHVSEVDLSMPGYAGLLAAHTVTDVQVGRVPAGWDGESPPARPSAIPGWGHLPRVRRLSFCRDCEQHPDDVRLLLASPLLCNLRELDAEWRLTDEDIDIVAADPKFATLRRLAFGAGDLTDGGAVRLIRSPHLGGLTGFGLSNTDFGPAVLDELATAEWFPRLTRLALSNITEGEWTFGPAEVACLLADERLGPLSELTLNSRGLGAELVGALVGRDAPGLTALTLAHTTLTTDDLARLVRLPGLAHLSALDFYAVTAAGPWLAAFDPATGRGLRGLRLYSTGLGPEDIGRLARTPHLRSLRSLDLGFNALSDRGAVALAASPHLTGLREVNLLSCDIGEVGAVALSRSPFGHRIRWMDLYGNPVVGDWTQAEREEYWSRPVTEWPPGRGPRSAAPRG